MKIKNRLGDADADRTDVHQIKSTTSAFDFRRVLIIHVTSPHVFYKFILNKLNEFVKSWSRQSPYLAKYHKFENLYQHLNQLVPIG